ncbi:hypothetical protein CEXT_694831 [Caerostris extrusa]|uniref:Uncharacterized protein n=1 Tax=Caerostris extrusa TaxID=172846 RepID=A0AAV4QAM7_CAEEX|nr:hypothetical protein CEXT_694831 [Caerostris extrusa]
MFHHCDGVHLPTTNSSKTASLTKISGIIWATAIYGWLLMINVHRAIERRLTLAQLATVELFIRNTNMIDSPIISSLYGRTLDWHRKNRKRFQFPIFIVIVIAEAATRQNISSFVVSSVSDRQLNLLFFFFFFALFIYLLLCGYQYHYFNLPPEPEMYGCVITRGSRVEMDGHIFPGEKYHYFNLPPVLKCTDVSSPGCSRVERDGHNFSWRKKNRAEMFHHCDGVHLATTNSSKTASLTKISGIIWATAIYGWLLMINVHRAIETRLTLAQLATVELFIRIPT